MPKSEPQMPRYAERIASLRKRLGMNQTAFAKAVEAGQGNVSKWESGANKPSPDVFARLARMADGVEKLFFLEQAGIPSSFFEGTIDQLMTQAMVDAAGKVVTQAFFPGREHKESERVEAILIPLLADAIAAGSPLTINERDIKGLVPMLPAWLPKGGNFYGVRVQGDSMAPTLLDGYIAFVDVSKKNPAKLIDRMVAARIGDGTTIKWLRYSNKHYVLHPQHSSPRHEVRVMTEEDDWAIIGEVVKWIGEPPTPARRKS